MDIVTRIIDRSWEYSSVIPANEGVPEIIDVSDNEMKGKKY